MIHTDLNLERARKVARVHRRLKQDDVMRCGFGLGLSLGLGFGTALNDNLAFYPTSVPGCLAFWDPMIAAKLTYGATPKSSGPGTPPAVTFSYGTVSNPTAIRLEAQSTTTYRWGPDNNGTTATWSASGVTIVPGATQALGSTGVSVVFPASGTYANTQVWETTLQTIVSANSAATLTQATASKQPRFLLLTNGQYGWRSDGVDDTLICSTIDLPAPSTTPTTYWGVFRPESFGSFNTIFSAGPAGTGRVLCSKSFASYDIFLNNGANTPNLLASNVFGRHLAEFSNATSDAHIWRASAATPASAGGFDPAIGVSYGSRMNDASTFSADSWACAGIWGQLWSPGSKSAADAYVTARFGAGLV